jgi:galactonate dehydratase
VDTPANADRIVERFAALRESVGREVDIGIDFHGRVSPAMGVRLARALEPYAPMFIEEPVLPENVDALVTVARSTTIPIATGERLFTKWGFREVLEKQAAVILQPDLSHAGGILEVKKIAAMAECYYSAIVIQDGYIDVPQKPGLGIDVDEGLLQEKLYDGTWETPRLWHPDGSVADW